MDDDENDNEDDDDDDVYDDVVLKVPSGTPMVPSSRIRFATTSRKYSWRQVARTERQVALQKRSAFTQNGNEHEWLWIRVGVIGGPRMSVPCLSLLMSGGWIVWLCG